MKSSVGRQLLGFLFVVAIFAFVFKEAFPALTWLDLGEFLSRWARLLECRSWAQD